MNSDTDSDSGSERERSSDPNEELLSSDDKTCHDEDDDAGNGGDASSPVDDDDDNDGEDEGDSDGSPAALAETQQLLGERRASKPAAEAIVVTQQQQQIDVATVAVAIGAAEREPLVANVRESVECFYSAQDLLDYGHMLSSSAAEQRTPDVESGYFDKSESDDVSREEFELVSSSAAALRSNVAAEEASPLTAPRTEESLRIELSRFCTSMEAFERQQVEHEVEQELLVVAARQHCSESEAGGGTAEQPLVDPQSEPYLMQVYRLGKWKSETEGNREAGCGKIMCQRKIEKDKARKKEISYITIQIEMIRQ